jgi:carbon monoxide dehydrogenase subunit G
MEVTLKKSYPLPVSAEAAWRVLSDLRATAACMPGAEITEQTSDTSFKGLVKVKVGPATAQFAGTVDVAELSLDDRRVVIRGKGADRGGSSASLDLKATVVADPANAAGSMLDGEAVMIVNGKFAQFGGRMMTSVSDMILGQFVDNFKVAAAALEPAPDVGQPVAAAPAAAPAPKALNGLQILWVVVRDFFLNLFARRA